MTTVADILSARQGYQLAALPPTATVRDALQLMADRDIGSVLLMQGDALLGIFTERDYARKIALKGLSSTDTLLVDVITERLYVVGPQQTLPECLAIMTQAKLRHLPVIEVGQVVGLISIGDLVNAQLTEQRVLIAQLENYIAGNL
ncbi:MAG: CBS domain-containing protein [Burkholderiaceae bacterium]|jgi:CBS domain-containing protein|nr:CBS domain-containing protein [Burkholderiaceae bacterium]